MDWISGAKAFLWALIVMECLGGVISIAALAANLPPTKHETGPGLRALKVIAAPFMVWFLWNIKEALIP